MVRTLLRLGSLLLGLALTFFGLAAVSMCGPTVSQYGALVGAFGGIALGVLRRRRRLFWFAEVGGAAAALATIGFQHLLHGSCEDWGTGLLKGVVIGAGLGLLADLARRPPAEGGEEEAKA